MGFTGGGNSIAFIDLINIDSNLGGVGNTLVQLLAN